MNLKRKWAMLILLAVPFVLYLSSIDSTWILDDHYQVEQNKFIQSFEHLPKVLTTRVWRASSLEVPGPDIYRPVFMVSYMIDYYLFGSSPVGFHLVNLIIHCLNVLLLFLLAIQFFPIGLAAVGTMVFAIHPITVEAVTWIACRADLLSTLFALLTGHLIIRRNNLAWLLVLIPLGIFSKESYAIIPFAVVAALVIASKCDREIRNRGLFVILVAGFVTAACLAWRQKVIGVSLNSYASFAVLRNFTNVMERFAALLLNPSDLDFFFAYKSREFFWSTDLIPFLMAVFPLSVFFLFGRKNRAAMLGLALFVAPLIPVSMVVDQLGLINERYFYLPLAGFSLMICASAQDIWKRFGFLVAEQSRKTILAFILIYFLFLSLITFMRNREWKDEVRLLQSSILRNPNNHIPYWFLSWHYHRTGEKEMEIQYCYQAIRLKPDNLVCITNLSVRMIERNRFEEATRLLNQAYQIDPNRPKTSFNYGFMFEQMGKPKKAIEWYQKALNLDPNYALAQKAVERMNIVLGGKKL